MGWKNLSYSIKGGIIGIILFFVSMVIPFGFFYGITIIFLSWFKFFLPLIGIVCSYPDFFDGHCSSNVYLAGYLFILVEFYILGAIIGALYSKIKKQTIILPFRASQSQNFSSS